MGIPSCHKPSEDVLSSYEGVTYKPRTAKQRTRQVGDGVDPSPDGSAIDFNGWQDMTGRKYFVSDVPNASAHESEPVH